MNIINFSKGSKQLNDINDNVAIIGMFDGIHKGHKKIIKKLFKQSRKTRFQKTVITFKEEFVKNNSVSLKLFGDKDKKKFFEGLNFNNYILLNNDDRNIEAQKFIKILQEHYNVKQIIVGEDFRFGENRQGDIDLLKKFFGKKNVFVIKRKNSAISTTKIKGFLQNSQIKKANKFLLTPYSVEGVVVQGKQLARKIGYPTANIDILNNLLVPFGVYLTKIIIDNQEYDGLTCYLKKGENVVLETYALKYSGTIYGEIITVKFIEFIRSNVSISSLEELKMFLDNDYKKALKMIKK
ncbi:riboflavin biosynthesis protein RibF [Spiroplasma endosymbiont of Anurida maritima]|uniref:riboflavin biosynthesis protein RibF n=1 Tax=Spiroplasma endosymbiont of Anurida maritima TaxID=2967972 RepID=UPI0036D3A9DF